MRTRRSKGPRRHTLADYAEAILYAYHIYGGLSYARKIGVLREDVSITNPTLARIHSIFKYHKNDERH